MKHFFTALCILLCGVAMAQNRYEIITEALCWTVGSTDSSLMRVVLQSTRTTERITLGYYNAQGTEITVAGGTLALGWCDNCTIAAVDGNIFKARGGQAAVLAGSGWNKSPEMAPITLAKTTPISGLPMLLKEMRVSVNGLRFQGEGGINCHPPHYFACLTRRKFLQRRQDYYLT